MQSTDESMELAAIANVIVFRKDSYLKQNPNKSVQSPQDLNTGNAIAVKRNARIFGSVGNTVVANHYQITCTPSIGGITTWYVYAPDVDIQPPPPPSSPIKNSINLEFTGNSFLKLSSSSQNGAIAVKQGEKISVDWCAAVAQQHRKVKLTPQSQQKYGQFTWYVYASHVAIAP